MLKLETAIYMSREEDRPRAIHVVQLTDTVAKYCRFLPDPDTSDYWLVHHVRILLRDRGVFYSEVDSMMLFMEILDGGTARSPTTSTGASCRSRTRGHVLGRNVVSWTLSRWLTGRARLIGRRTAGSAGATTKKRPALVSWRSSASVCKQDGFSK